MRVHASFGITDITSTVSQITIFFDRYPGFSVASSNEKTYESLKKYASNTGDVLLVNHVSGSQVVGIVFKGFDEGTVYDSTAGTNTYRYLNDLWYSKYGQKLMFTFQLSLSYIQFKACILLFMDPLIFKPSLLL